MEVYIRNVSKIYGKEYVLQELSFEIMEGQSILIYGKNGAGKTTLLKILNFLEKPSDGEVLYLTKKCYLFNKDSLRDLEIQKKMVYLSQIPVVFTSSVYENILMGLKIRKERENRKRIFEMVEKFGLYGFKDKCAVSLSTGQKQKLSLIRSLILDTELLLFDEPTNNLDEMGKMVLKEYLIEKKKMGVSFIITTPDLKEWENFYFDKIFHLKEGRLNDISSESQKTYMGKYSGIIYGKN